MIMATWALVLLIAAIYTAIAVGVCGWYMCAIPPRPEPVRSKSSGKPLNGYKTFYSSENRCYYWYSNQEFIDWDKQYGEAWFCAYVNAVFWVFLVPLIPYILIYKHSHKSSSAIRKRISDQHEKYERLAKIAENNALTIRNLEIEAEKELGLDVTHLYT